MRKRIIGVFVALVLLAVLVPVLPAGAQTLGPLHHVLITPTSATIAVGGTQQFTAQGQDANNVPIPNLIYVWALVGGGGLLSNTGLFTAGNITGPYTNTVQVIAVQSSTIKLAYASVTVTAAPGPLHHVVITPTSTTIKAGGKKQFTAQGQDANNVPITNLTYVWALVAGGGTVNNAGLFTAGNITGPYTNTVQVIAVQSSTIKTTYASVTVTTAPQAKVCVHPGWCKGKKTGWHDDMPPGWCKGKKTGWHDDMPPGWSKGDKIGWQDCLHLSCSNRCDIED